MPTFVTVILAILAFGVLIVVHELGHFLTAKKCGIQVNEFWIGMGPTLFSHQWRGTKYRLNLLPFGGACVMEGEDGESDNPHAFSKVGVPRRMLVVVAGACMNFLIGFLILFCLILPSKAFLTRQIDYFENGFQYQGETMLMVGDEILKIDGYHVLLKDDVAGGLARGGKDGSYDILVRRDGQKLLLQDVPIQPEIDDGQGGKRYGISFRRVPATLGNRLQNALYLSVDYGRLVWDSLGMLVSGQVGVNDLSGPVGVADVMSQAAKANILYFFQLVAFISINLGVMNLLPLPALDGGRLVFLIIEAVRGKPVPARYEGWVHGAGLALLMLLMVYVTGNDILRIFQR